MSSVTISPRWSWKGAFRSVLRHTVMPVVGGAAVAAIKTMQSGQVDPAAMKSAALGVIVTAVASGATRFVQYGVTEQKVVE